jgi:hypothetical protein
MPSLKVIEYSRQKTVSAVRDYYLFLSNLYLDESSFTEPPPDGWPSISHFSPTLNKTQEVTNLLRELPCIRSAQADTANAEAAPNCTFADWPSIFQRGADPEITRTCTENVVPPDPVPKAVIGLTYGATHNPRFLLDTNFGTVQ